MKQFIKDVGLDGHKETTAVAVADSDGCKVRYSQKSVAYAKRTPRPELSVKR